MGTKIIRPTAPISHSTNTTQLIPGLFTNCLLYGINKPFRIASNDTGVAANGNADKLINPGSRSKLPNAANVHTVQKHVTHSISYLICIVLKKLLLDFSPGLFKKH